MANELTYGRKPVVIVDIIQPRCANRFGTSPCTATGTPKCYNTYWTCKDTANYDPSGSITWRFSRPRDNVGWLYEETDANNLKTNAIPILVSASTTSSRINPGSSRKGESPLGRRSSAKIVLSNGVWDDNVGDFYLEDRATPPRAGFWSLFSARNPFYPGMQCVIYEGYEGQNLGDMQARRFDVEQVEGPGSNDEYTITCRDPLDAIRKKNAKYPPTSQIDLRAGISASETAIPVACLETQLSLDLGNTGGTKYLVIGDEVIRYTGWTGTEPEFTLTGVVRGDLGTAAATHEADAAVQRAARHVNQRLYNVARYIIEDHTAVPDSYINGTQWDAEGETYLSTLLCDTLLPEPVAVEALLGELCRDGLFSIYWDDRAQTIPLRAERPPNETPVIFSDENNIINLSRTKIIDDRMTRVSVFFRPRNFLDDLEEAKNYENRRVRIDSEVESEEAAGGKIFENVIYSRWTQTFGNALLISASLLLRFRLPPEYVTLELDAKDRSISLGDVVDLETRHILDSEGQPLRTRWQVIGIRETSPGSRLMVELQSYRFVGKFSFIMANDAPNYATATDAEKEFGCWISENSGLMPDGSEPYLLQ